MRILGIDPGLTRCGLGIVDLAGARKLAFVDVRVAKSPPSMEQSERVHDVAAIIDAHLAEFQPEVISMERVFSQHNVTTVMGIAHISGAIMFVAGERNIPVHLYTPTQVKAAVSGHGAADKAQVQTMVARILGLSAIPKPADAADALAIAICHAWNTRSASAIRAGVTAVDVQEGETAAQKMWREAERRTSGRR